MPRNIVTEMTPMMASVCAAFFARGWRNAGTPSEIASTPGERGGAGRERVQDHEQPDRGGGGRELGRRDERVGHDGASTEHALADPDDQQREDRDDERVRGHGEERSRLLDPSQVRQRDQYDEPDRQLHPVGAQPGHRRDQREHAGDHRHGDGQHVVRQQRGRGQQSGPRAEVLLADDVGAAAVRVRAHRLAVRGHHDHQEDRDRARDRHRHADAGDARDEQHAQDLLGRVRDRGEGVGGEHRQREDLGEEGVLEPFARDRAPQQQPLDDLAGGALGLRVVHAADATRSARRPNGSRRRARS